MDVHTVEHLKLVSIKDVIRKDIELIETGTELFYFHELNKYLEKHGLTLDFSTVKIDPILYQSNYYSYFVQRYPHMRADDIKLTNFNYLLFFHPDETVEEVKLKKVGDNLYEFDYYYDYEKNRILHKNNTSLGYVSLFAFSCVESYIEGVEQPVIRLVIKDKNTNSVVDDSLILAYYGNKLLEGKLEVSINGKVLTKSEMRDEIWSAYHYLWNQRGYMPKLLKEPDDVDSLVGYSVLEKYKHLKKNYMSGDVVFLYERTKTSDSNKKARIDRCFLAVIKSFDESNIVVEKLVSGETWLSQFQNCDRLAERDELEGTQSLHPEDYSKNVKYIETYNLTEIGIDMLLRYERTFILELNDFDEGVLKLWDINENGKRRERTVPCDSLDYAYAIIEERGLEYNKPRFLAKYFKDRTPIYEKYRDYQVKPSSVN